MPVEVKICGLTDLDDARVALENGADYLGFVFYPPSPRAVTAEQVGAILTALPPGTRGIGVFVNRAVCEIVDIVAVCGLYAAQVHGDECPEGFENLPFPVWRAVRVGTEGSEPDPASWPAARYVVDADVPGAYGGTGERADWSAAAAFAARQPAMLAGGLTAENVADAVREVRPLGVDVSSGVEAGPGRKDHAKLVEFIRKAKPEQFDNANGDNHGCHGFH